MFSRTRVHPVAAAATAETNTDSNRGVLERGAPSPDVFDDPNYFDIPDRSQDSQRLRQQENDIRQRKASLQRDLPELNQHQRDQRQYHIKLLQEKLDQQKEIAEEKRIQRKARIIAEMEAERNRPPPSYYSSLPAPMPTVPVPTVPAPMPAPTVRRPWYHRIAERIENHPLNRPAPPSAAQIARRRARRIRKEESALRREERREKKLKEAQDELQKQKYEDQKDLLKKLYIKYPNKSIPDKEFPVYPAYHKTLSPEIRRIPKPYSYEEEDNKKKDKNPNETETKKKRNPNLLKKIKRLLTQKNVIPRKKSPVPPPKQNIPLMPPPEYDVDELPFGLPSYSSRKYKLRSTQRDYTAGGRKKTRRVKKMSGGRKKTRKMKKRS